MDSGLHDFLAIVGASIATGTGVGALLKVAIISPLSKQLETLSNSIGLLRNDMRATEDKRQSMVGDIANISAEMARIDSGQRSAHHRIDSLEKRVSAFEGRRRATDHD